MTTIKAQVKVLLEENLVGDALDLLKGKVSDVQYEATLIILVNRYKKLRKEGMMDLTSGEDHGRQNSRIVRDILGLMEAHFPAEPTTYATDEKETMIAAYEKAAKRTDIVRYLATAAETATLSTLKNIHEHTLGHRKKYTSEVLYELLTQGFVAQAKVQGLTVWSLTPQGRKALYRILKEH
ncbi:MAG: hypothetical protein AAF828_01410 [Bacteroidota bacterium]